MNKRVKAVLERAEYLKLEWESNEKVQAALEERKRRMDLKYLMLIGESAPDMDATDLHSALVSALRFARAFRLDAPVIVGETSLLDLERRIFYEAQRTKVAYLCADGTLSERTCELEEPLAFDDVWVPLPGSELPIEQAAYDEACAELKS